MLICHRAIAASMKQQMIVIEAFQALSTAANAADMKVIIDVGLSESGSWEKLLMLIATTLTFDASSKFHYSHVLKIIGASSPTPAPAPASAPAPVSAPASLPTRVRLRYPQHRARASAHARGCARAHELAQTSSRCRQCCATRQLLNPKHKRSHWQRRPHQTKLQTSRALKHLLLI